MTERGSSTPARLAWMWGDTHNANVKLQLPTSATPSAAQGSSKAARTVAGKQLHETTNGGQSFLLHSVVLASASPYFKA